MAKSNAVLIKVQELQETGTTFLKTILNLQNSMNQLAEKFHVLAVCSDSEKTLKQKGLQVIDDLYKGCFTQLLQSRAADFESIKCGLNVLSTVIYIKTLQAYASQQSQQKNQSPT